MIDVDMQNGERTELSDAELDCVVGSALQLVTAVPKGAITADISFGNFAMSVWATAGAHGVAAANG